MGSDGIDSLNAEHYERMKDYLMSIIRRYISDDVAEPRTSGAGAPTKREFNPYIYQILEDYEDGNY